MLAFGSIAQAALVFHSNPLAAHPIFVDCDTYPWAASDDVILQVLQKLADIWSPFDVDLTNVRPSPQPNIAEVIIGGPLQQPGNIAGYSVIGNWTVGTQFDTPGNPVTAFAAHVYADGLNNMILECAVAAAHELGHQVGLTHEDSGIMFPTLIVDPVPTWTTADLAYLGNPERLGLIPEPYLLTLLPVLLMRREK